MRDELGESLTSEVKCQVCGKAWPEEQSICPEDGTWLHDQTIMEIKPRARRNSLGEFPGGAIPEMTGRQAAYDKTGRQSIPPTPVRGTAQAALLVAPGQPIEIGPGTVIGEYEVEDKIGEGAMGTVYRAIHPAIHKRVAIKIMTPKVFDEPESVKRFVAEARAVAAIEHPGIVDVFGFGRIPDGRTYLVMEWLDGQSLGERLKAGPLPWHEACEVIRQIARALEAAHAKGIVHRDLKPDNVFLQKIDDDKPVVKLLDFGLAKTTRKEDALVARTRSGQLLGTPLYMSPEQCKSKGVDHRTDIYALGCMTYELLCGRTPFDADNVAELISAHLVAEPPRPSKLKPDIPPDLDKLLFNMVAKDVEKRPPLGEIRRLIGMQLTRPSEPMAIVTPPHGTDAIEPVARPTPTPDPMSSADTQPSMEPAFTSQPPRPAAQGRAATRSEMTDEEMLATMKRPAWHLYAAAGAVVALVVVLILALS